MGREKRTLRTYGKHRQRVISSDIWSTGCSGENKKHVFSSSSSFNSSANISSNSSVDSIFAVKPVCGKGRGYATRQKDKENRAPRHKVHDSRYGSDGESNHSTKGKRKRVPNTRQSALIKCTETPSYDFSEFDDYSLVVSSSSKDENQISSRLRSNKKTEMKTSTPCINRNISHKSSKSDLKSDVETSTPFAKRTKNSPMSEMSDNNLSYIDHVEESHSSLNLGASNNVRELSQDQSDMCSFSRSPMIVITKQQNYGQKNSSNTQDTSPFLKLLKEKMELMHVSMRIDKQKNKSSHNASESLFSSTNETELSEGVNYLTADEQESCEFSFEEEEDSIEEEESTEEEEGNSDEDDLGGENVNDLSDIFEGEEEEKSIVDLEAETSTTAENATRYMVASHCGSDTSEYVSADSTPGSPNMSISRRQSLHNASLFNMITPRKVKSLEPFISPETKIFQICEQTEVISFNECIPPRMMKQCKKVGEGVYGEVFITKNRSMSVALKVIPIEGCFLVNDEKQKTFGEILPEIVISQELSLLRNHETVFTDSFCEVRSVSCIQGSYPPHLLKEWDKFDDEAGSENDRPDIFKENQLFIMFEFANGGKSLESFKFDNIFEARSVFAQTAFSLAAAEEALEFEHRDLHVGNILVKPTKKAVQSYKLMGQELEINSEGMNVCVIDFTLSRLKKDGNVVYTDLSTDEELFKGSGNYQFDIYRMMQEENGNEWKTFHPRTNVFWLHYIANELIHSKKYKRNAKQDQAEFRNFRLFVKNILNFNSACELVTCSEYLCSLHR